MPTECTTKPLDYKDHGRRCAVVAFYGSPITTDASFVLPQEIDRCLSIFGQVADFFADYLAPYRTQHRLHTIIAQRTIPMSLGIEVLNDNNKLRHHPMMA